MVVKRSGLKFFLSEQLRLRDSKPTIERESGFLSSDKFLRKIKLRVMPIRATCPTSMGRKTTNVKLHGR